MLRLYAFIQIERYGSRINPCSNGGEGFSRIAPCALNLILHFQYEHDNLYQYTDYTIPSNISIMFAGLESIIYRTISEHANHYTTEVVTF
jgi:hypothetical protein